PPCRTGRQGGPGTGPWRRWTWPTGSSRQGHRPPPQRWQPRTPRPAERSAASAGSELPDGPSLPVVHVDAHGAETAQDGFSGDRVLSVIEMGADHDSLFLARLAHRTDLSPPHRPERGARHGPPK